MDIKGVITNRIERLSNKSKHYVISLGSEDKPKEEKIYHKAGKGKQWCGACERIRELKRLQNIINRGVK